MAKLNLEIDTDDLGVLTKHRVRMETDQDYRDRALTPPGGKAPGEGDKPADKISGDLPVIPGVIAADKPADKISGDLPVIPGVIAAAS